MKVESGWMANRENGRVNSMPDLDMGCDNWSNDHEDMRTQFVDRQSMVSGQAPGHKSNFGRNREFKLIMEGHSAALPLHTAKYANKQYTDLIGIDKNLETQQKSDFEDP